MVGAELDNPLYDEDWMEDYLAVGCKYCGCYTFKEKQC